MTPFPGSPFNIFANKAAHKLPMNSLRKQSFYFYFFVSFWIVLLIPFGKILESSRNLMILMVFMVFYISLFEMPNAAISESMFFL